MSLQRNSKQQNILHSVIKVNFNWLFSIRIRLISLVNNLKKKISRKLTLVKTHLFLFKLTYLLLGTKTVCKLTCKNQLISLEFSFCLHHRSQRQIVQTSGKNQKSIPNCPLETTPCTRVNQLRRFSVLNCCTKIIKIIKSYFVHNYLIFNQIFITD